MQQILSCEFMSLVVVLQFDWEAGGHEQMSAPGLISCMPICYVENQHLLVFTVVRFLQFLTF